jgi:hypothetical protein
LTQWSTIRQQLLSSLTSLRFGTRGVSSKQYTTVYLTLSQQKYVTFALFVAELLSHCSELMPHQRFRFATEVPASHANDFDLRDAARCT